MRMNPFMNTPRQQGMAPSALIYTERTIAGAADSIAYSVTLNPKGEDEKGKIHTQNGGNMIHNKTVIGSVIYVDGNPKEVVEIKPSSHGFMEVFVGEYGVPSSRHNLPRVWLETACSHLKCKTGGHTYSFVQEKDK